MKKSPIILILLAIISFTGCKRNASETQKTLTSSDSTAVIEQVEKMYNELFACQNKNENFDTDSYISTNLKTLWESLPENELVYSANVWTGLQDFDSLILEGSGADGQRNGWRRDERRKDTIVVSVRFRAFDGGEINTAHVKMVYERNGWYIDDIVHTFKGEEYSIVEIAKMQIPDSVVYYYKAATNGESNIIELKYKDGKITDGYFWGTSDEFCDAREGYYPGFAVWPMKEIQMNDNILTFLIDSRGETYSSGPVSVEIHSMAEAFEEGYHPWMQKSRFFQDTVRYTCTLTPDSLVISHKSKYNGDERSLIRKTLEEIKQVDRSCGYEEKNQKNNTIEP